MDRNFDLRSRIGNSRSRNYDRYTEDRYYDERSVRDIRNYNDKYKNSNDRSLCQRNTNNFPSSRQPYIKPIKIGPLYFHHIFDRDGLNNLNRPIQSDIFTAQKQLLLIDGEKCINRLFGGGFQEYWTSGVTDETMDMLRNMDLYAHSMNCFIVLAFQGRLVNPDLNSNSNTENKRIFDATIRRATFFASENEVTQKALKSVNKEGSIDNFVVPTAFRHFVSALSFHSLKCVYTEGDHVETICRWLAEGVPNEYLPESFIKGKFGQFSNVGKQKIIPNCLLGYENEYLLFLMDQREIRYFMSPTE